MPRSPKPDLPTLVLADALAWSHWLSHHASTSPGIWLTLAKKNITDPTSLTLLQALDEALCHGWINGQGRSSGDPGTTIARFTPRGKRSTWSQVNVRHVERLAREGRMRERGWEEVGRAKGDGRWEAAYDGSVPEDLEAAVLGDEGARGVWEGLGRGRRSGFAYRLVGVRTEEGRRRAIERMVREIRERSGGEEGAVIDGEKKRIGKRKREEQGGEKEDSEAVKEAPLLSRGSREQRAARRAEGKAKSEGK